MAIIHPSTITPSKAELVSAWIGTQAWAPEGTAPVERVGGYRFDDPAGEVGIEGLVFRASTGALLHVPVTYRDAEVPGLSQHLIGTMDHSVLGQRWVYDGAGDSVFIDAATQAIIDAGGGAIEEIHYPDGSRTERTPTVFVAVHGHLDGVSSGRLSIIRVLDLDSSVQQTPSLVGTWEAQPNPVALLELHPAPQR